MSTLSQPQIQDIYPLSPMQEGMLYHALLDPDSDTYFQQNVITLQETLNPYWVQQSLQQIVNRYDVFRTIFLHKETERPLQVVVKEREAPTIIVQDVRQNSETQKQQLLAEFQQQDRATGFHLDTDVPLRIALFQWGEGLSKLVWSFPHIIMDGWCLGIVAKDFFAIYKSLRDQTTVHLETVYPFSQFIQWIERQDKIEASNYWNQYLEGLDQETLIPGYLRSVDNGLHEFELAQHTFRWDSKLTNQLEQLARQHQVTVSTVFQAAWGVMLQSYNYRRDVVFGAVVSGRPEDIVGIEEMVGLFINTLPVRVQSAEQQTFSALLVQMQTAMNEGNQYSYQSLAELQNQSVLKHNLLSHILVFENYPLSEEITHNGSNDSTDLHIVDVDGFEQTNYDLTVMVIPGEELEISFSYNLHRYESSSMLRMADHLTRVIEQIIHTPDILLSDIQLLTADEWMQVVEEFNTTNAAYPSHLTIHEWFAEQVERTPNQLAVRDTHTSLTYKELDQQSSQLAHMLRAQGVGADHIVGIMMERSHYMMVSLLAILKAGAAYLPLDPAHPQERLEFILQDSGTQIVVTTLKHETRLPEHLYLLVVDKLNDEQNEAYEYEQNAIVTQPSHLAYVIYTSGTTGNPKGAMIEHRSLVNRIHWMQTQYPLTSEDVILQKTPYSFDVSVWELFWWSTQGASVVFLEPEAEKDPAMIIEAIARYEVTTMHFVPSMLSVFLEHLEMKAEVERLSSVRYVFASGEALQMQQVNRFNHLLYDTNQTRLINLYGPTEATIDVSYYDCSQQEESMQFVPIGRPIDNIQLYIMNTSQLPQPVGVPGELCIAGVGLARGYLNREQLTAEKFVRIPHQPQQLMYRTGDLARWLPDGNIEYMGRLDHQVKIRGYRIELAEIESVLLEDPSIKECIVLDRRDEQHQAVLCAYLVSDEQTILVENEIRTRIASKLPEYMIPTHFIMIANMPVTSNGKIDRRYLQHIELDRTATEYVQPTGDIEKKLASIWQQLLHVKVVSATDSFFQLGGHSLKASQLVALIHQQYQIDIPLRYIFKYPILRDMATCIATSEYEMNQAIPSAPEQMYYSVTSAQRRLLILDQLEQDSYAYHIPHVLITAQEVDILRLQSVFEQLIQRHESFRTSFTFIDGQPVQHIHHQAYFQLEVLQSDLDYQSISNTTDNTLDQIIDSFIRPFDLSQAPLLRAQIIQFANSGSALLIDMHHIIADGVSLTIITDEFNRLYEGQSLPAPKLHYKDYAVWQQTQSDHFQKQREYWLEQLSGELPVLNLPTDFPRPALQQFEGAHLLTTLNEVETVQLKKVAVDHGVTLYMLLLAAYHTLLHKYTGQQDIITGSPIAGRPHADIQSIVGMFVNTLAMRSQPQPEHTFTQFLKEIQQCSIEAFEHQELPIEQMIDGLSLRRDLSRNPLFDVMLIVQTMEFDTTASHDVLWNSYEYNAAVSKVDLTLQVEEQEQHIQFQWEYATHLFKKETIEQLAEHWLCLLRAIMQSPEARLSELDMVTPSEKEILLSQFNPVASSYSDQFTIHGWFEQQVRQTPDAIALIWAEHQLTYQQLDEQANQLAHLLISNDSGPDRLIGLMTERSDLMIISLLAILKSGSAYVPIDPDYPAARVQYMLANSEASILITQRHLVQDWEYSGTVILADDREWTTASTQPVKGITEVQAEQLAYVIYTSGSTGQPKGVMLQHQSVVNFISAMRQELNFSEGRKVLALTTLSFDIFVLETLVPLSSGMTVVIAEEIQQRDPHQLAACIQYHHIDMIQMTPSRLQMLMNSVEDAQCLNHVQELLIGGEALPLSLLQAVQSFKHLRIYNMYGPTETTVWSAIYELTHATEVRIGHPILNTQIHIVNEHNQLQPIGIAGELCIAGAGLARGYWQQNDLTDEKFVPNPYALSIADEVHSNPFISSDTSHSIQHLSSKMYKTGDLARWLPSGEIEFLGRIDHQVKVRGYRIELGEIEETLTSLPDVNEAIVLAVQDHSGVYTLAAYLVLKDSTPNTLVADIQNHLLAHLPEYMVPSSFAIIDMMPLTPNGKIDRKALLHVETETIVLTDYIAPRHEIDQDLIELWSDLLHHPQAQIGIQHSFFELGGHSLNASLFIVRLREKWGIQLDLRHFFQYPTIQMTADQIMLEQEELRRFEELLREVESMEQL